MLHLVFSNRYETLATALLRDLAVPLPDPLAEEIVIAPSTAMRRRLELDYAQCFGVCANVRFVYLAQWLWEHLGRVVTVPETSPFAPDRLVWPIYDCLGDTSWIHDAPRLASYLARADDVMRYELASRLAHVFDQYLTYRLPWLVRWQAGQSIAPAPSSLLSAPAGWGAVQQADEQWQAALWRQLLAHLSVTGQHPAQQFLEAIEHWPDGRVPPGWPARISVFALPAMPPQPLQLLKALARLIDVHLYVLNPCQEYWYEIVPPSRLGYLAARTPAAAVSHDHRDAGHPLLAEWGRQTQSHIDLLYAEMAESTVEDEAFFVPNTRPTLLAALQNSLLTLDPHYAEHAEPPPEADGSVAVHVCHSLSRQIEVLHDHLLAWFDADPALRPDDILVTVPDLATAAPVIDAVFGTATPRIPYLVTGLPPSRTNPVARAFALILALPERQVSASDIVELARTVAVADHYQLGERALDDVQQWLVAAGGRRGWTSDDTAGSDDGVPRSSHTLGDALMRLLLGYALPDQALPAEHWLPVGAVEGSRAAVLGGLAQLVGDLESAVGGLMAPRSALAWRDTLLGLLATCFSAGPAHADDVAELRDAIERLCATIHDSTPALALPLGVIRTALGEALDDPARGGVPSGRVTFAALPSLRGLPYRAVCLLGMDDGVLPGPQRDDEFDLLRALPQRGDRQRRNDERNLFLDLLLAARDRFWLAYSGRSIRDNTPMPPAAVVDELLDELARMAAGPDADGLALASARAALVTEHPLQPFSPRYFDAATPALFSYDEAQCDAARALAGNGAATAAEAGGRFFTAPLPPDPDMPPPHDLSLDDLLRFWRHPSRFWLRERLGVSLREADTDIDDDEPFVLDRAGQAALAARLLPRLLAGDDAAGGTVARIAAASHELPAGATGAVWREREVHSLDALAARVRAALRQGEIERVFSVPLPLVLPDGLPFDWGPVPERIVLDGRLSCLTPNGMVLYRYGRARAADRLAAWLMHLALGVMRHQAMAHDTELAAVPHRTRWLGDGDEFVLNAVADPGVELGRLAALYLIGQTRPLPFFPRSAWEGVSTGQPPNAAKQWHGSLFSFAEKDDAYHRLAWRGVDDALADPFPQLAKAVFDPLIAHLDTEEANA